MWKIPRRYFYIVVSGRVEVLGKNMAGETIILNTYGPGSYFGEVGLIENKRRGETVRAHSKTPVETIALNRSAFLELIETSQFSYEELAQNVYEKVKNVFRQ